MDARHTPDIDARGRRCKSVAECATVTGDESVREPLLACEWEGDRRGGSGSQETRLRYRWHGTVDGRRQHASVSPTRGRLLPQGVPDDLTIDHRSGALAPALPPRVRRPLVSRARAGRFAALGIRDEQLPPPRPAGIHEPARLLAGWGTSSPSMAPRSSRSTPRATRPPLHAPMGEFGEVLVLEPSGAAVLS